MIIDWERARREAGRSAFAQVSRGEKAIGALESSDDEPLWWWCGHEIWRHAGSAVGYPQGPSSRHPTRADQERPDARRGMADDHYGKIRPV